MAVFVARELGLLLAALGVAYVLGALLLGRLELGFASEALAFRTGAGLGAFSCLALALALTHALRPAGLLFGIFALVAVLAAARRRDLGNVLRLPIEAKAGRPGLDLALVLVVATAFLLGYPALFPPTAFDAIFYHLPAARLHLATNSLAASPWLHLNFMPQAWELVDSLALMVGDDVLAQLLQASAMLLVALAAVGAARRVGSGRAASWAGALWLGSPALGPIASAAYVDVGLTLFVLLGVLAVGRWLESNETGWLAAGAFFLGMASSTKYIGVVFAAIAGAAVLAAAIRRRRPAAALLYAGIVGALFLPWVLRTYGMTRTPFGYFGAGIFGVGRQDPFDVAKWATHMRTYGYPRTLANFAALPWNVLFHPERFLEYQRFSPWLIGGLPLAIVGAWRERRVRWPLAAVAAYVVVWFLGYQNTRFLLPVLALLALPVAAGMQWLLSLARLPPVGERAAVLVLTAAILWPSWRPAIAEARRLGPIPSVPAERDRYLARMPGYDALKLLNESHGDRYVVYSLLLPSPVYYARGVFIGNWFGPRRYETVLPLLSRPSDLHADLRSFGVTHLLVSKSRFERVTRTSFETWKESLAPSFRSLYADSGVELFELMPAP